MDFSLRQRTYGEAFEERDHITTVQDHCVAMVEICFVMLHLCVDVVGLVGLRFLEHLEGFPAICNS